MEIPHRLRTELAKVAPVLWDELSAKAYQWVAPAKKRLERELRGYPKTFNDPVWGDIVLFPWETLLLDSPLLQRLRGVRQLGMAHLVYPGASHDRLEHSRGVVEAAERMIRSLERNAEFRRKFGKDRDETVPTVSDHDRSSIRLAALLHDIGHGAFSHTTEQLISSRLDKEFKAAALCLREVFSGVTSIAPGEIIAAILILSEPLKNIFESPNLGVGIRRPTELPFSICARILGSREFLDAGYLSGIVSGPLDADKLDYMARDSHHAGLPIGLDLHRLISKLEVVTVTPNVTSNPEMRARAEAAPNQKYHEIGISLSGLGAYEQMIVGRAMLYDRLYYHHKVRSAEAMVRRLIQLAEEERGTLFAIRELFFDYPDDTVIFVIGGMLKDSEINGGKERCTQLANLIHDREVHYRAFAFAPRFISGISVLPDAEKRDARALLWNGPLSKLSTLNGCDELARVIFEKAKLLIEKIEGLKKSDAPLNPEHIVVDLPVNKVAVRGGDILTRTEDGYVATPNLFFDPEKWSQAYEHQKQCGFVFTHRDFVPAVGLASRIVFFERFNLVMDAAADRASKTERQIKAEWLDKAVEAGLCSKDCALAYQTETVRLVPLRIEELKAAVPDELKRDGHDLVAALFKAFVEANPAGFAPSVHQTVLQGLTHLLTFLMAAARNGLFVAQACLKESELQEELRKHLCAREAKVIEGTKEAGGEADLVLSNLLVIENKVVSQATASPLTVGEKFSWQARRYAIALATQVAFEVVAYKPSDDKSILPISQSVSVSEITGGKHPFVSVRFVIPWGHSVPSRAAVPKS